VRSKFHASCAFLLTLLPLILLGCSETTLSGPGADEGEVPTEDAFPEFDGATLELISPLSGEILMLDEDAGFEAVVLSAAGEPMDFELISWSTDQDPEFSEEGREVSAPLESGIHAITATAELPNGDRLQSTHGGIRVQGLHTGIYAGSLIMELNGEFQGTPITTNCAGALDFVVDMEGEVIDGSGECSLSLVVLGSIDVAYNVNGDIDDDDAAGSVSVDVGFFPLDLDWEGGFEDQDDLIGSFSGELMMFDMEGTIDAHRLSRYVDP
jgi:hypothetical protein